MLLRDRADKFNSRFMQALSKTGRSADHVKVIAVSKLQPADKIIDLSRFGYDTFGENYIQEALSKIENLQGAQFKWHFIGRLQSNKAKEAVGRFDLIHSLDRESLAIKISQLAELRKISQACLIQVNLAEEKTKSGIDKSEVLSFFKHIRGLPGLKIRGLMVMPPLQQEAESSRAYFIELRELGKKIFEVPFELSMGTSQDFEVAIEEGSTMIRIGSELFGPRPI